MHPAWARELRDACICPDCGGHGWTMEPGPAPDLPNQVACERCHGGRGQTAFFFKQWGGRTPKAGGRLLDGREWNDMPLASHVTSYPKSGTAVVTIKRDSGEADA